MNTEVEILYNQKQQPTKVIIGHEYFQFLQSLLPSAGTNPEVPVDTVDKERTHSYMFGVIRELAAGRDYYDVCRSYKVQGLVVRNNLMQYFGISPDDINDKPPAWLSELENAYARTGTMSLPVPECIHKTAGEGCRSILQAWRVHVRMLPQRVCNELKIHSRVLYEYENSHDAGVPHLTLCKLALLYGCHVSQLRA